MIKTIKLNYKIIIICILLISYILILNYSFAKKTSTYNSYKTPFVLIDAGHGGLDGGAVGLKTGVKESDLNLEYAKTLKNYFESLNYKAKLVRSSDCALSEDKQTDMLKRKALIESSNCDIFISIHMNKFALSSSVGAQTFYKMDDELSKNLATNIQNLLIKNVEDARKLTLPGDYLVLNSAKCPAVLVECGFLSNEKDEKRLQTKSFRENLCYQIFCGTIKFLTSEKN
ncbi:MAG: N-acetylmuramoyl-L-alanine amidase [Christensenellales bacterium]